MKKANRIITLLLTAAAVLCLITGCGGKKELNVDVNKLADELNSSVVTSDQLTQTSAEMIPTIYYLDAADIASACAYMSSGATACEITVIACSDEKKTADVKAKFEQRVASQSELYASYNAEEVTKLDKAIMKTAGKYAVLCVSDDNEGAEKILKNYGF